MPVARLGNVEIHYDDQYFSDDDPPLVLVAGLGAQLIFFEDEFVQGLIDRAFRVIRIDNRDVGLSTRFADAVDLPLVLSALAEGREVVPPYTLSDMARDVVAVLDHLRLESAHLLGVSLGGMVAQLVAIEHPERVRSLSLLSSTTGAADVGQPTEEAMAALLAPGPTGNRDAIIEHDVEVRRVWSTTDHFDEAWTRGYFARCYDRSHHPEGVSRQMVAVLCAGEREQELSGLGVPTLVMHGTDDKLLAPSGGARLAELIPDAQYVELEGMGHDLPPHYWAPVIEAITALAVSSSR